MEKEHKIFGAGTDQELSATKQASNTQARHIFRSDEMPQKTVSKRHRSQLEQTSE